MKNENGTTKISEYELDMAVEYFMKCYANIIYPQQEGDKLPQDTPECANEKFKMLIMEPSQW